MTETTKKSVMTTNKTILRPPTREEIAEAGTNPSDYQIAQVRILSKILSDFGLVSRVYRSKKVTVQYNNRNRMKSYRKKLSAFFKEFKDIEQVANARIVLDMTEDNSSGQFLASDYISIFKSIDINKNHSEEFIKSLVTDTYKKVKGIDTLDEHNLFDIDCLSRDIFNIWLTTIWNGHTIDSLNKAILLGDSINQFMRDDEDMKKASNILYADRSIETVSELKEKMEQFIEDNIHDNVCAHTMTHICDEANKNLDNLSIDLKLNNYVNGLTVANVMDYFKTFKPSVADTLLKEYGFYDVTIGMTWEDVANFFYTPEMIRKIEVEKNRAINRPRSNSDRRKGCLLTVDKRSIEMRKKNLLKKIGEENINETITYKLEDVKHLNNRLKEKEKQYKEAKVRRARAKAEIDAAILAGNISSIDQLKDNYEKIKYRTFRLGKDVSHIKYLINKAGIVSNDEVRKSHIATIRELEEENLRIINKVMDIEDENQEIVTNEIPRFDLSEINYRTWSFIINSINPKIVGYILKQINETLPQATDGYFNVDAYEPDDTDIVGNATEIIIDYPAESKLCKIFKKNRNSAYDFIDSMVYGVRRDLGIIITYIRDKVIINETF